MKRLFLLALASCGSSDPDVDPARIESLEYAVPSGWKARDLSTRLGATFEWTPIGDNDRKESLVVSRVARPAIAKSRAHIRRALVETTDQLPHARFFSPASIATRGGLSGVRVEGTFIPPGKAESYHRIHAVLVDGESLVHVLYTARDLDREHFDIVLDGVRPGA